MTTAQEIRLFATYFKYDADSLGIVWKIRYQGNVPGTKPGCVDVFPTNSYRKIYLKSKQYREHQIVWELFYGSIPKGFQIDHIDGNGLNNTIENLRLVTASENRKNSRKRRGNKSGFTGVIWYKATQKWMAYINDNCKRIHLGFFIAKEEAIAARKIAEQKYHYTRRHGYDT